jgi:ATP-dependent exoDNAse (exonuclease V) alpha subunit
MQELTTYDGAVHSIIFQNAENGYTVLRLLTEEGEVVTVVGCIPCAAPGEHLTVSGVWEQHPQHGEQLKALEQEREEPVSGETRARELVQRFLDGVPTNRELIFNLIERVELTADKQIILKFRFRAPEAIS